MLQPLRIPQALQFGVCRRWSLRSKRGRWMTVRSWVCDRYSFEHRSPTASDSRDALLDPPGIESRFAHRSATNECTYNLPRLHRRIAFL